MAKVKHRVFDPMAAHSTCTTGTQEHIDLTMSVRALLATGKSEGPPKTKTNSE